MATPILWACKRIFRALLERAGALASRFGLTEWGLVRRIVYAWSPDRLRRMEFIRSVVLGRGGGSVLDVGGNVGTFRDFLPRGCRYVLADIDKKAVNFARRWRGVPGVVADGTRLPFRDNSFEWVVAVEVMEHVPPGLREGMADELKRVASRGVIAHCPCRSNDGAYVGDVCDEHFDRWHREHWGRRDPNVAEDLACGVPTAEALRGLFPGGALYPSEAADEWLWLMERTYGRLTGYVPWGLFLRMRGAPEEATRGGPARSVLLVWLKESSP